MFKSIALFFSKQGVTIIALLLISLSGAYYIERTKRVSLEQSVNTLKDTNKTLGAEVIRIKEDGKLRDQSNIIIREAVTALSKEFVKTNTDLKEELEKAIRARPESSKDTPVIQEPAPEIDLVWNTYYLALGDG